MNNTTAYEVIDRLFSSYVVTCMKGNTRFYLTSELTASDILARAVLYRWPDDAYRMAEAQREEKAWADEFEWDVESYASQATTALFQIAEQLEAKFKPRVRPQPRPRITTNERD